MGRSICWGSSSSSSRTLAWFCNGIVRTWSHTHTRAHTHTHTHTHTVCPCSSSNVAFYIESPHLLATCVRYAKEGPRSYKQALSIQLTHSWHTYIHTNWYILFFIFVCVFVCVCISLSLYLSSGVRCRFLQQQGCICIECVHLYPFIFAIMLGLARNRV